MTDPEVFKKSYRAEARGKFKGQQSVAMYEKSLTAIDATRELILQLSQPQPLYRSAQQ